MALHWTPSSNSIFLLYWGPLNWTQHSKCGLTSVEQGRRMASVDLLSKLCLRHPRIPLAAWPQVHIAGSYLPWHLPEFLAFFCQVTSQLDGSQHILVHGAVSPRCKALHSSLLNVLTFLWAHFSSLWKSLQIAAGPWLVWSPRMKYEKTKNRVIKETFQALQKL